MMTVKVEHEFIKGMGEPSLKEGLKPIQAFFMEFIGAAFL